MAKENIVIFHHDCEGVVNHWSIVGELVRCKDCKYFGDIYSKEPKYHECKYFSNWSVTHYLLDDDYCSCAERKEGRRISNE